MAVLTVNEVGDGREGTDDQNGVVVLARSFEVFTSDTLDDQVVVLASSLIPAKFAQYVTDTASVPAARCVRRNARQHSEDPRKWSVRCDYSTKWLDEARANPNPVLRPAKIGFDTRSYTKVMIEDLNGVVVMGVNAETFDPTPSHEVHRLIMTIDRFQLEWDPVTMNQFNGALNSGTFFAFTASRVRCNRAKATSGNEGEYSGWNASFEFEFLNNDENIREWQLVLLSTGFKERVGGALTAVTRPDGSLASVPTGGTVKPILSTVTGHPPPKPVLLDAYGAQLIPSTSQGTGAIATISVTTNVATVTTSVVHGLIAGNMVTISGNVAVPVGSYTVASTPTTTTFTFAVTTADIGATAGGAWMLTPQYLTFKRAPTRNFDDLNLL